MEEEREKMRQEIRDKVRNRAIPLIAQVNYPTNPQLSLRDITCERGQAVCLALVLNVFFSFSFPRHLRACKMCSACQGDMERKKERNEGTREEPQIESGDTARIFIHTRERGRTTRFCPWL